MTLPDLRTVERVHRPVQYLGSKMRVLDEIAEAVGSAGAGQTVWEPFTGSSVVAQALAGDGHRVVACDALASSATFAKALLGVNRAAGDCEQRIEDVALTARSLPLPAGWEPWLAKEAEALREQDGAALLHLGRELPQRWRRGADGPVPEQPLAAPLLSDTFAGTYFGLGQALRLERLRAAIDATEAPDRSPWSRSVALTALCEAASRAVYSAGKHFAQPHHVPENKDLGFHARRALADRAVDVEEAFLAAGRRISRAARPAGESHSACARRVETVGPADLKGWGATTVYADPPYTAQQYSRFYHLLETLVAGVRPDLQLVRGRVTKGLYPTGRYLSPFCSRRQAPEAFRRLAATAADAGARLVLSYSATTNPSGATGNARTVALADLVGTVRDAYPAGRVTVRELDVQYRQFNQRSVETAGRRDPEYLIIGDPGAR